MKTNKPDFIIAGERRSGTSTLYEVLKRHQEIAMLPIADYDFFICQDLFSKVPITDDSLTNIENLDIDAYFEKFQNLNGVKGQKDADLLWWQSSHKLLGKYLPDTLFVIILRDPIERAISQYHNEYAKGRETLSFEEAIKRDINKCTKWEKLHLLYKERGCYADSLKHFYQHIPKNKVKVVILEELIASWDNVISELSEFLNVGSNEAKKLKFLHTNKELNKQYKSFAKKRFLSSFFKYYERYSNGLILRITKSKFTREKLRNSIQGWYKESERNKFQLDKNVYKELETYYLPHKKELEQLINKDIPFW